MSLLELQHSIQELFSANKDSEMGLFSPICICFNLKNIYLENATPSDKFHVNSIFKIIRSMRVTPCKMLCIIKFITASVFICIRKCNNLGFTLQNYTPEEKFNCPKNYLLYSILFLGDSLHHVHQ